MGVSAPGLVIDQETLDHLPAFHKAIAEVLIEKGRWQLADSDDSENRETETSRTRAGLSDRQRCGAPYVYNHICTSEIH